MIVVLSGEGPSDFGCCTNGQGECQIPDFRYGPMTYFIDTEIKPLIGYLAKLQHCGQFYLTISSRRCVGCKGVKAGEPFLPGSVHTIVVTVSR